MAVGELLVIVRGNSNCVLPWSPSNRGINVIMLQIMLYMDSSYLLHRYHPWQPIINILRLVMTFTLLTL